MASLRLNRRLLTRIAHIAVSIAVCYALYRAADWHQVLAAMRGLDPLILAATLLLFVPQWLVSAWRWRRMIADVATIGAGEAVRQTLAASAFNLILPSKIGDFSKAAFVPTTAPGGRKHLAWFVLIEKGADLGMTLILCLVGTQVEWFGVAGAIGLAALLYRFVSAPIAARLAIRLPSAPMQFCLATWLLWLLHIGQIHGFLLAAGVPTTWDMTAARAPLGLLAGVVPAAFCGIGPRDAAFVWLFSDVAAASTMAAVGLLTALRYVVPGVVGIPCLWLARRPQSAALDLTERSPNRPRQPQSIATAATP